MAEAGFTTLPFELREEIWHRVLFPEPAFFQHTFPGPFYANGLAQREERSRWMIPQRKYPTAMHVCQEARHLAQSIIRREHEQEQGADSDSLVYYLGRSMRPFISEIDTLWLRERLDISQYNDVPVPEGLGWDKSHRIQRLAVSFQPCLKEFFHPSPPTCTLWKMFLIKRMKRGKLINLKRIDIVFGPTWVKQLSDTTNVDDVEETQAGGIYDVPIVQLEEFTDEPSGQFTMEEVKEMLRTFHEELQVTQQQAVERAVETKDWECGPLVPLDFVPRDIAVHASRMVNLGSFKHCED